MTEAVAGQQVDGQKAAAEQDDPDAEAFQPLLDIADRPEEGGRDAAHRDDGQPEVEPAEAEHRLGHVTGHLAHGPELERRPADQLHDVDD